MPAPRAARLASLLPHDTAGDGWFDLAATLLVSVDVDGVVSRANASACRYANGAALAGAAIWETPLVAAAPSAPPPRPTARPSAGWSCRQRRSRRRSWCWWGSDE